jgi:phage terminase small subunit
MSAKASASRMLNKPSIVQAMKQKLVQMEDVEGC